MSKKFIRFISLLLLSALLLGMTVLSAGAEALPYSIVSVKEKSTDTIEITISNSTGEARQAVAYLAYYSESGQLKHLTASNISISADAQSTVTLPYTKSETGAAILMIVSNTSTFSLLTAQKQITAISIEQGLEEEPV